MSVELNERALDAAAWALYKTGNAFSVEDSREKAGIAVLAYQIALMPVQSRPDGTPHEGKGADTPDGPEGKYWRERE
jgi:hypothetical protein